MKTPEDEEFERIERQQIELQKEINALKGTHMDRQCYERGCACIYYGVDTDMVSVVQRNDVLEEVAREFDRLAKTSIAAATFAQRVREMKECLKKKLNPLGSLLLTHIVRICPNTE